MLTRTTKTKELVTQLFHQSTVPLSLEQAYRTVKETFPKTAYSTVYRIAQQLQQAGQLTQVDWRERGSFFEWADRAHHHHVVCENCGQVTDLDDQTLGVELTQVTKKTGYIIKKHSIELTGVCAPCQTNYQGKNL